METNHLSSFSTKRYISYLHLNENLALSISYLKEAETQRNVLLMLFLSYIRKYYISGLLPLKKMKYDKTLKIHPPKKNFKMLHRPGAFDSLFPSICCQFGSHKLS